MIYIMFQGNRLCSSGEEDFLFFLTYIVYWHGSRLGHVIWAKCITKGENYEGFLTFSYYFHLPEGSYEIKLR